MQNYVKALIVNIPLIYFIFFNQSIISANEIKKVDYENAYCLETISFAECTFKDGYQMIGEQNVDGQWNGNVKVVEKNNIFYYFFRAGDIRYGVKYYDNGYYLGDLTSEGLYYGFGTYYFNNGDKRSYQNWHEEKKIGYYEFNNGITRIGRFDENDQLLIEIPLDKDFQLKLNNMELLAQSVQEDFNKKYNYFLTQKRKFLPNNSEPKDNSETSNDFDLSSNNQYNKPKSYNLNLIIGLGILFIFIVIILWKNASPSKITQTETKDIHSRKDKQEEIDRYKNLSLEESRKLFSYGVKEFMSVPEACRQLRSEYFKWTTVSNNPDGLKKSLSQKNMNNIIRLRKKLGC